VPERSFNQRACIIIIHAVIEIASTLLTKTSRRALRLQVCSPLIDKRKIVTGDVFLRSPIMKQAQKHLAKHQTEQKL
jgi:hypothetical protein